MSKSIAAAVLQAFPSLNNITDEAWQKALSAARILQFESGSAVFRDGDVCRQHLLIASGAVRLCRTTEMGREIILKHIGPGQVCELTSACLISGNRYPVSAIAEVDVTALAIPQAAFEDAIALSPAFRHFIFAEISKEVSQLLSRIEEMAAGHLDCRLAHYLLEYANSSGLLIITHQALAAELGTAREVVSRALKPMERSGWIKLYRGRIEILREAPLLTLSGCKDM